MSDGSVPDRPDSERATFIVRLWRRSDRDAWRGQVEHVQSGERAAAPSVSEAIARLRRWLDERGRASGTADR